MRVVVLGAGHVGRAIARILASTDDFDVSVVDHDKAALSSISAPNVATVLRESGFDAFDVEIRGRDVVVNALPFHLSAAVAAAARQEGCHYIDLTEDVAATRDIRKLASGAGTAFVPQCGLAPGFVGIAARDMVRQFDEVLDVKIRVGAIPLFSTNSLGYAITWSVEGLINEYCHIAEGIRDGRLADLTPLEGLERVVVDGAAYEAFNTAGGLGTLCESLIGSVRSLDYKTIRYPGHCTLMKFLLDELGLKFDRDTLARVLRNSIPTTPHDVVILLVAVIGRKGGSLVQDVLARKIVGGEKLGGGAVQMCAASSACTVVDLLREGQIPDRGFVRQEDIDFDAFMANRFAGVFKEAGEVQFELVAA